MIEGRNAILSSMKKAEQGEALILRLYNPSNALTQALISLPFTPHKVQLAGLDENVRLPTDSVPLLNGGKQFQVSLPAGRIITLRVTFSDT
jgi:alpha-mannosidase